MNTSLRAGPIVPTLLKLSLPVMAGQLFNLLYNVVDTWFITRIDPADPWLVGSTGLVFPLMILFWAASIGLSSGISSLVARSIGAGKTGELDRCAESGLALAIGLSLAFLALVYPLARPVLQVFGGQGQTLEYALEYLLWVLPMLPALLIGAVFTGILQGEGRTQHMMVAMIIGTVANIILDPLLIFVADMGIGGAGLATSIGNWLGTGYLFVVLLRSQGEVKIHWNPRQISGPVMGEILRVGLPQSLMHILMSISFIFYNRLATEIHPKLLSGFTLYARMEQAGFIPLSGLANGLGVMAGQAAGAGDFLRVKKTWIHASLLGAVCSALVLGLLVLLARPIFFAFQEDQEVIRLALDLAPWMAAGAFLATGVITADTVFAAAGYAGRSLVLTAIRVYGLNVPAAYLACWLLGLDAGVLAQGIFYSSVIAGLISVLAMLHFLKGLQSGRLKVRSGTGGPVPEPGTLADPPSGVGPGPVGGLPEEG